MKFANVLKVGVMCLLSTGVCHSQNILLPSLYVGTNRYSLDSEYNVLNPSWGGQIGFNIKAGCEWIQFDGGWELGVKGLRNKYNTALSAETGRVLESDNSVTSYGVHATLPLGVSIGYYTTDDYQGGTNVVGGSIVGGGFVDIGIWGQNRLTQKNRLSQNSNILYEESNVYSRNCFGGNSLQRKRFDAGIYFGVAFTTSLIGVSVIYRKGFINISNIDHFPYKDNGLFFNLTFNCTCDD